MNMPGDEHDAMYLIERYYADELDAGQVEAMWRSIESDEAFARRFAAYTMLESHLWERGRAERSSRAATARETEHATELRPMRLGGGTWGMAIAIAAAVALAATVWIMTWSRADHTLPRITAVEPANVGPTVGTVTEMHDAVFENAAGEMSLGGSLPAGPIRLASGSTQIMFASTAVVELVGPCSFEMIDAMHGRLDRGQLTAYVPDGAHGFAIETPHGGRVVDMGTRFDLFVDEAGLAHVTVMEGRVRVDSLGGAGRMLSMGEVARIDAAGTIDVARATSPRAIPLGNLFDDPAGTSLERAIASDTFGAAAHIGGLAVAQILHGGDVPGTIQPIVPEESGQSAIAVDLRAMGWTNLRTDRAPANDAWSNLEGEGGIRTTGRRAPANLPRTEQGVGMHANLLLTLDLAAIRKAGFMDADAPLRFVADRAGLDDTGLTRGSVHLAVLVSDEHGVIAGQMDGREASVIDDNGVYRLPGAGAALRGRAATRFDVALPPSARYLTLIVASAGDTEEDHAVFAGARIEVGP
ncbi:MAG: hypothetical protein GC162_07570 [Planctomycetes bacterium]|nr:hypothetical protein [Planctomycetota bacterium]